MTTPEATQDSLVQRALGQLLGQGEAGVVTRLRAERVLHDLARSVATVARDMGRLGLLTTAEVAARYGVRPRTANAWCERGLLRGAIRMGPPPRGQWFIPEEALRDFTPPRGGRPRRK